VVKISLNRSYPSISIFVIALVVLSTAIGVPDADPADYLKGKLLIAAREMKDPRFTETVIKLLQGLGAEDEGATGEIVVHYGGPVSPRQAFILHTDEMLLTSSRKLEHGIALTSDADLIREIARGKGPREALLIFGYAGWAPGQLENELKARSWFAVPADKEMIFGKDAEKKWRQAIDKRQIPL
jgi:putative transcriptional regulator